MNRAEKAALAKWLNEIADKLTAAPDETQRKAKEDLERAGGRERLGCGHHPYQVGALSHIAESSAESLRAAIRAYLEPKKAKP